MGRGLEPAQRADLWKRWREGQSLSDIARALAKPPGSVFGYLAAAGGISPYRRTRSERALTLGEREEISRGLSQAESIRSIARRLSRAPSTVSREIARNGGLSRYRAVAADEQAWEQGRRPKRCKLAIRARLQRVVASKLRENWSPEQIACWLEREYPKDDLMRISHETIYRSLYIQARGVLKKELQAHLRTRRKMRRAKCATTAGQNRGGIIDAVSIRERPADVERRAVPGHWEGDLITGSHNTHIATLVERKSRFTMLVKVDSKDTATVVHALAKHVAKLPMELRRSLTWDRGMELAHHKTFTVATDVQRGSHCCRGQQAKPPSASAARQVRHGRR